LPPSAVAESQTLAASAQRIEQRITELSAFGANPEGGGNYDRDVGVIGAIEVAQLLHEHCVGTRP